MIVKSIVIKGRGGKFGGCTVKVAGLTSGGLRCVPKRGNERFARVPTAVQNSTDGIVVGNSDEGPNDGRKNKGGELMRTKRQNNQMKLAFGKRKPEAEFAKGKKSKWRKHILTT